MTATRPRSGHASKISPSATRTIINQVKANPNVTSRDLQTSRTASQVTVHASTIRRTLNQNAINGRVARKKHRLSKKYQTAHLNFARDHLDKPEVFWKYILWTNESKIDLVGHNQHCYAWRKSNTVYHQKNLIPTVKHGGGNVKIWGWFSSSEPGRRHIIKGTLRTEVYQEILEQNVRPSVKKLSWDENGSSNKTSTQSIQANLPKNGSGEIRFVFCIGQVKVPQPSLNWLNSVRTSGQISLKTDVIDWLLAIGDIYSKLSLIMEVPQAVDWRGSHIFAHIKYEFLLNKPLLLNIYWIYIFVSVIYLECLSNKLGLKKGFYIFILIFYSKIMTSPVGFTYFQAALYMRLWEIWCSMDNKVEPDAHLSFTACVSLRLMA